MVPSQKQTVDAANKAGRAAMSRNKRRLKSPDKIREIFSMTKEHGGGTAAKLNDGRIYRLDSKATNGMMPKLGSVLDISKHTYLYTSTKI